MKSFRYSRGGRVATLLFVFVILATVLFSAHERSVKNEMARQLNREAWESARISVNADISDIQQKLEEHEGSDQDASIRPGQQKQIRWHSAGGAAKTPWAIVYLHGFSAGPLELEPTISNFANRVGANLFFTRLSGHALMEDPQTGANERLAMVTAADWVRDTKEAIAVGRIIGEKILVVGTSTGAALALQYADALGSIDAMILLSPNYEVSAFGAGLLGNEFGRGLAKLLVGKYREFPAENELQRQRWTTKYRSEVLHELILVTAAARAVPIEKLEVPVLTVYTERDQVVSVSQIESRSARFRHPLSRTVNWPKGRRHELASETFHTENSEALVELMSGWASELQIGSRKNN